jgi:site-specific recombinase XerD
MTRAVVSVLIYGGLRRKELLDLRVDDVDLAEGRLLIRSGKGRKSRSLYVPEECVEALRDWLAVRQGMGCRHPYLFTTDPRRRMGDNGLNRIMAAVRTMADLGDRTYIMPHAIRHEVATRLLQNGADLRSIQSILGHSDLKTTSMYLHTDELQLKRAADLTRFRDRDRRRVSEERRRPESRQSRMTVVGASHRCSRFTASARL